MYSVFLSSYRNTRESLELEKAVETLACVSCSHSISQSSFYLTIRLRALVFYEQIINEAQPS